jgi:hypothetical protein
VITLQADVEGSGELPPDLDEIRRVVEEKVR